MANSLSSSKTSKTREFFYMKLLVLTNACRQPLLGIEGAQNLDIWTMMLRPMMANTCFLARKCPSIWAQTTIFLFPKDSLHRIHSILQPRFRVTSQEAFSTSPQLSSLTSRLVNCRLLYATALSGSAAKLAFGRSKFI